MDYEFAKEVLISALAYLARGWPVFPCDSPVYPAWQHLDKLRGGVDPEELKQLGKLPLVRWKPYQTELPAQTQADYWWGEAFPGGNIALATGQLSGVVILDLDTEEARALWEANGPHDGPKVVRGDNMHVYLAHPGERVKNAAGLGGVKGLDVRGDGGMVLVPPSLHRTGSDDSEDR